MLCFIPTQLLNIENINLGKLYWHTYEPPKPISPLIYTDGNATIRQFCLLTPFCKVKLIDYATGRIQLEVIDQLFYKKMIDMQNALLINISIHYKKYFSDKTYDLDEIKSSFQPLVDKGTFTVYIPYGRNDTIKVYEKDKGWREGINNNGLNIGDSIRVALKIYGIAYEYNKSWTGRSRIQHQVVALYRGNFTAGS